MFIRNASTRYSLRTLARNSFQMKTHLRNEVKLYRANCHNHIKLMLTLSDTVKHREVVLFLWDLEGFHPRQLFSVASEGRADSVKARAIVAHVGNELMEGAWSCSKDGKSSCVHIRMAHQHLASLSGGLDADNPADPLVWGESHNLSRFSEGN